MTKKPRQPRKAQVGLAAQEAIGHQLRAMYSEIVRQPLPDTLLTSFRAIDEAEDTLGQVHKGGIAPDALLGARVERLLG